MYLFWWGSTVSVPGSPISRAGVDRNTRSRLASCLGLGEGDHRDGEGDDGEQGGIHLHKKLDRVLDLKRFISRIELCPCYVKSMSL